MENIAWMAWTLPTAIFFVMLALTLGVMTWLAAAYPEAERVGVLRIATGCSFRWCSLPSFICCGLPLSAPIRF
jgi:predicted small integral membrane protein